MDFSSSAVEKEKGSGCERMGVVWGGLCVWCAFCVVRGMADVYGVCWVCIWCVCMVFMVVKVDPRHDTWN